MLVKDIAIDNGVLLVSSVQATIDLIGAMMTKRYIYNRQKGRTFFNFSAFRPIFDPLEKTSRVSYRWRTLFRAFSRSDSRSWWTSTWFYWYYRIKIFPNRPVRREINVLCYHEVFTVGFLNKEQSCQSSIWVKTYLAVLYPFNYSGFSLKNCAKILMR